MRIVRFRDPQGRVRYGVPDPALATAEVLLGDPFAGLSATGERLPVARLLAPVAPVNILCIGLNYRDHARETGAPLPDHPVLFMKATSAVNHPGAPIPIPACAAREVDYEVELAVVIGRAARDVTEARALGHVLGYTVANDVSARRWQKHGGGGQWVRGKSFDGFCPLGPVLVTADEVPDPQALELTTEVNGRVLQLGTTADMIFPVARLIAELSRDLTLLPGTVLLTGTPAGVGFVRDPPLFLAPGDTVTVAVAGIGRLTNPVVAAGDPAVAGPAGD